MTRKEDLVRLGLVNPTLLATLTLRDWDLLIRHARSAGVLGRLYAVLEDHHLLDHVPQQPRNHLEGARLVASSQQRVIRWEVYCIERALRATGVEIVLLKGAAYVVSEFAFARGRIQSDVDILVPKARLRDVETALLDHGWIHVKVKEYDQRFYRQWSHELPPLFHPERSTVIDVHHNIVPVTGRLHPDPEKLLARAEPVPGMECKRLSGPDMLLHTSAHMFQDGDLERGLREFSDVDGLIRLLGRNAGFWPELLRRAPEMDLHRPLFYALRYARQFFETRVPQEVLRDTQAWAPPRATLWLMDDLVAKAMVPKHTISAAAGTRSARWLLYVRSQWLRMPPLLLTRHLLHKTFHGWIGSKE